MPMRVGVPSYPYSFLIEKRGDLIVAQDSRGRVQYSGTDASTVVQSAINALYGTDKEGDIYIKRAVYDITSDITIGKRTRLIAEMGTVFNVTQNLTNGCIVISSLNNEARWGIEGLKIDMNYYNGHAIYSAHAGHTGHEGHPTLKNIKITDIKAGYCGIYLIDAFFTLIQNIEVRNNRGTGLKFGVDETKAVHFGNSIIDHVYVGCNGDGAIGLDIVGGTTYRAFNLSEIRGFRSVAGDYTDTIGVQVSRDRWISFYDLDLEDHKIGVNLTNCRGLKFAGGYIGKASYDMTAAVRLNDYVRASTFDTVKLEAGTGYDIQDLQTKKYDDVLFINCHSEDTPPNFVLTPVVVIQNWYRWKAAVSGGIGVITSPFVNTSFYYEMYGNKYTIRPIGGDASAPTPNRTYVVANVPVLITSTGGTGVSITISTDRGDVVASGLTSLTAMYLPVGYQINFGNFSVAPTVTVAAIN